MLLIKLLMKLKKLEELLLLTTIQSNVKFIRIITLRLINLNPYILVGDKIVKTAMDSFGRVDVLINNAGILRDVSMIKMTDNDWDLIMKVHLKGTYSCTKACWDIMRN